MTASDRLSRFSENDVLKSVQYELYNARSRLHPHDIPHAIILAGQPGSGKTVLSKMYFSRFSNDIAFVNGDDYRNQHPHYQELHRIFGTDSVSMVSPFSNEIANRLISAYSDLRFNLIVEGTGRTVEVPKSTAEQLTEKGYSVEMAVLATRPEVSLASTLLRYYRMSIAGILPRATAISAHDLVVGVLPKNLDILATVPQISRISIWDREQQAIYDSSRSSRHPSEALKEYWNAAWSNEEIQSAEESIRKLKEYEKTYRLGQIATLEEIESRVESRIRVQRSSHTPPKVEPSSTPQLDPDAIAAACRRSVQEAVQEPETQEDFEPEQ